MTFGGLLTLLALIGPVSGATTIIPLGARWDWLPGSVEPNDSGTGGDWRQFRFEYRPGTWTTDSRAELGFGDGDEVTVLPSGHMTYYFRCRLALSPGLVRNLGLRVRRDDGIIVYLNGTEIFRNNMPEGPVNRLTPALAAIGGTDESTPLLSAILSSSVLNHGVPGLLHSNQCLAVEVHQSSLASSDLSFDLELSVNLSFTDSAVVRLPMGFGFMANSAHRFDNTLKAVLPSVFDATEFWRWLPGSQSYERASVFDGFSQTWNPNVVFATGEGAFINSPAPQNVTLIQTDTNQPGSIMRPLNASRRLVGPRWLVSSTFEDMLGFGPVDGDRMLFSTNAFAYTNGAWNPTPPPLVEPGAAVFVELAAVNPPSLVVQPQSRTVDEGSTVVLFVTAEGTQPIAFQWHRDGVPIAGANNSFFGITNSTLLDAGVYSVIVSNPGGSVVSSNAVLTVRPSPVGRVFINEWLADNQNGLRDEDGDPSDWFELFNADTAPIDVGGLFLTDNVATPTLWPIPPGMVIPARGYLLVWASTKNRAGHANFQLSISGDLIRLYRHDGVTLIDSITFGSQTTDISQGRCPDGGASLRFMQPTPRAANDCPAPQCVFITCPTNQTVDCSSPLGTPVNFTVTGTNLCFPPDVNPVLITCVPSPGSLFLPGTTRVDCEARSLIFPGVFQTNYCNFAVTVLGNCSGDECFSLAGWPEGAQGNPWEIGGYRFTAHEPGGGLQDYNSISRNDAYIGLFFEGHLDVELPAPGSEITLQILRLGSAVTAEGFRLAGPLADRTTTAGPPTLTPETLTLRSYGDLITRVRLTSAQPALLLNVCFRRVQFNGVTFTETCKDYASRPLGPVANPLEEEGVKISAINSGGGAEFAAILDGIAGRSLASGYYVQHTADLEFTPLCRSVRVDFFQLENPVDLTAFDESGAVVAGPIHSPGSVGPSGVARSLELASTGNLIRRVLVHAPNALATIQRVCCQIPREGPCVDFPLIGSGSEVNPLVRAGYTITTLFHRDPELPWFANRIITVGGETGLRLAPVTDIRLSAPCPLLELGFRSYPAPGLPISPMTVETFDPADVLIETHTIAPPTDPATVLTLRGNIQRVALTRTDTNAILTRICCKMDAEATGTPLGPYAPLGQARLSSSPDGSLLMTNISFSGLDGLRVDRGEAASIQLDFTDPIPASMMPTGATFGITLRGQNAEALGVFGWTALGDFWYPSYWNVIACTSYQPISSPTYTARIYSGNQLVHETQGLQQGIGLRCLPSRISAGQRFDGQLLLSFDYGNSNGLFRLPVIGDVAGTRIELISERPNPSVALNWRTMDLRWGGVTPRPLVPVGRGCISILVPDVVVTCAGKEGSTVYYTVVASNHCTQAWEPVSCSPRSGTHFELGTTFVTCFAGTASQGRFGGFRVTVTRDESGALIENPSFEVVATTTPAGGVPFSSAGAVGWTALTFETDLFGPGGFDACSGINYAGLRAETVNDVFKRGMIQGSLRHPLSLRAPYQFMACLSLRQGTGVWVEFVLSDGNPAHEQIIAREFVASPGLWQSLMRGVSYPTTPGEVPGVRFTATHAHDRILVRTIPTFEGIPSNGYVFVDDLRLGCFEGLAPGRVSPQGFTIRWTGEGVLESSPVLGPNAQWLKATDPMTHEGNVHEAFVPTGGNQPMRFFRLRMPGGPCC